MSRNYLVIDVTTCKARVEAMSLAVADQHATRLGPLFFVAQSDGLFDLYNAHLMPLSVLLVGMEAANVTRKNMQITT